MTKAELIDAIANEAGVTKADAEKTVGAFFAELQGRTHHPGDQGTVAGDARLAQQLLDAVGGGVGLVRVFHAFRLSQTLPATAEPGGRVCDQMMNVSAGR